MFEDKKRKRGLASLALAGLVGFSLIGCSAALPAGRAQPGNPPGARQGRLVGDPYQAGTRSKGTTTIVNTRQLTGTHPGGGGPQE
jgi:hypothetical protein